MKQRQLIKVVGTSITGVDGGRMETTTARGIIPLKRGQTILDFIGQFLNDRGVTTYSLYQRGDGTWATSPMMYLTDFPKRVLTFHFLQFDLDDLGYHAKDLTAAELERDMKPLTKLIYKS